MRYREWADRLRSAQHIHLLICCPAVVLILLAGVDKAEGIDRFMLRKSGEGSVKVSPGPADSEPDTLASVYLPDNHPAYETLELFRAAGLLDEGWWDHRPLSRVRMAQGLSRGTERARALGLDALARLGEWRLRVFSAELGREDARWSTPFHPLGIGWRDDNGASLYAEPTMELAYDMREDIPPDNKPAVTGRAGFEIYGTAGSGIGYAARYRRSKEVRDGSLNRWDLTPERPLPLRKFSPNPAPNAESSGHISWDGRVLGFDLSYSSPAWGPSPSRNLMLSGHAPNMGNLQGRVEFGNWLRYAVLVATLKSGIIDSVRSYQPEEPHELRDLERSKQLVGHRIDLRLGRSVRLGLMEMVIFADRAIPWYYLVPTVSLYNLQDYQEDRDNSFLGLDMSWAPKKGPRLYGSITIDEWHLAETFSDSLSQNWMAFQVGASWTPHIGKGRWHLWLEATRVLPNVYRHAFPVNDWTHADRGIGFWSGQNSEVLEGSISCVLSPPVSLRLWGRYARKGGEVTREEQYDRPPIERFMLGDVRTGAWVGLKLVLETASYGFITANVVRAPAQLWPQSLPGSAGEDWQFNLKWAYNPF